MPLIDAHVHLYPPEVDRDPGAWAAAQGERHWAVLCTRRRRDGRPVQTLPTMEQLLRAMDAAGVDRAMLLGWYWEKPETCAWQNRFYAAAVRAHPDRLAAFATLHPAGGREATLEEVRRAHGEGLAGLGELSPQAQGYAVDDPVFREALGLAGELQLPVNLHVTDPDSRPFPGRIETPAEDFLRLARSFPATTFILAHWGGLLPLRDASALQLGNVFYDTAASPLLYDAGVWKRFLAVVPAERVLFGSDFPLNLYPMLDELPAMGRFVEEARAVGMGSGVMGENAARLLRLSHPAPTALRQNRQITE
ncbi:MAG: amidohydrolase [Verrucomicrobia bacterium]|nr:amidohydrolase [Verrucomicrobiota bacterium]